MIPPLIHPPTPQGSPINPDSDGGGGNSLLRFGKVSINGPRPRSVTTGTRLRSVTAGTRLRFATAGARRGPGPHPGANIIEQL